MAGSDAVALGPVPTPARPLTVTAAQREVYEHLLSADRALSLAQLSAELDQHPNTVRDHLRALVDSGLVLVASIRPHGRGRPAHVYAPEGQTALNEPGLALLEALVVQFAESSDHAETRAQGLGRDYAASLSGGEEARILDHLSDVMGTLGFSPEPEGQGGGLRLRQCPLLATARKHRGVVCGFHAGLVQGLVAQGDTDIGRVRLLPFAEPGACLIRFN